MENKTHYRKVFKSDHLGSADLEEFIEEKKSLIFTIKEVKQEYNTKVAGRKIDANIAYFVENIKPLVLNATNSKIVKKLAGGSSFIEDWKNILVELYIDSSVKMKGEVVGGVRIKEEAPKPVTQKELDLIKGNLATKLDMKQLSEYYNSDVRFKTSKDVNTLFKERAAELKQD